MVVAFAGMVVSAGVVRAGVWAPRIKAVPAAAATAPAGTVANPLPPVSETTTTTTSPASDASTESAGGAPSSQPASAHEVTLVDTSRPGPDRGPAPDVERSLRVVIRRPPKTGGVLPLIVFAHGYNSEPETYDRLLDTWAAAGYLVAAPELPGSARDLPGAPQRDIGDQARDVSFVTTWLLTGAEGISPIERFSP